MSSLKALIKQHNERAGTLVEPIRLTFGDEEVVKARTDGKGVEEKKEDDLQKPYKEVLKSPFTRRIIEFSAPSHRMPTNLKIYDGSTDPDDHITRFVGAANQGEWQMSVWFALRRKCCKDPTEVSKIMRKANETLPYFKESLKKSSKARSYEEENFQIRGKRPYTVEVGRLVRHTEEDRTGRITITTSTVETTTSPKGDIGHRTSAIASPCPPMIGTPKKENLDRYCDYHEEKGHNTNDCYQLKRQLEAALESGKLSYLVKDVRQRGMMRLSLDFNKKFYNSLGRAPNRCSVVRQDSGVVIVV
ncbi:hypothetical protein Tco_0257234 [Tanacetum coccineum]